MSSCAWSDSITRTEAFQRLCDTRTGRCTGFVPISISEACAATPQPASAAASQALLAHSVAKTSLSSYISGFIASELSSITQHGVQRQGQAAPRGAGAAVIPRLAEAWQGASLKCCIFRHVLLSAAHVSGRCKTAMQMRQEWCVHGLCSRMWAVLIGFLPPLQSGMAKQLPPPPQAKDGEQLVPRSLKRMMALRQGQAGMRLAVS